MEYLLYGKKTREMNMIEKTMFMLSLIPEEEKAPIEIKDDD